MALVTGPARPDALSPAEPASGRSARQAHDGWVLLGLAGFAMLVRGTAVATSGGLRTMMGYDEGVYFAATNAFLHGVLPYRDFVLLHPPGILLVGATPTWLGHVLGLDDAGTLQLVRLVFLAVGVGNALLVYVAGRHLSRVAGIAAACLYVVWLPMVLEERTILLEPIVATGLLAALALIPAVSRRPTPGAWRPVVAGMAGGLAVTTKLWAAVPIAVLVLALLLAGRWRRALAYVAAVGVSAAAVVGPFLLTAPSQLWHMVVLDQLGRPPLGDPRSLRLALMMDLDAPPLSGLSGAHPPANMLTSSTARAVFFGTEQAHTLITAAAAVTLLTCALVALRVPVARVWVALLAVQAVVLLRVPAFFDGYPSFVGPAAVLVAGAAVHLLWDATAARLRGTRPVLALGLAAGLATLAWGVSTAPMARRVPPPIEAEVAGAACVAADTPVLLALTNTLSTDLAHHCPPVVDFTGVVYTLAHARSGPVHPSRLRIGSPDYQRFVQEYFGTADRIILRREGADGLTRATRYQLSAGRPLLHRRGPRVYGPRTLEPVMAAP